MAYRINKEIGVSKTPTIIAIISFILSSIWAIGLILETHTGDLGWFLIAIPELLVFITFSTFGGYALTKAFKEMQRK